MRECLGDLLAVPPRVDPRLVADCAAIKAKVVSADERESDRRRILNFGHTIGHAVEAVSKYKIAHGSAVAMGMVAAAKLAAFKGILDLREKKRIEDLIHKFGLPITIPPEYDRTMIRAYLLADKKTIGGKVFFVLPTTIGKVIITDEVEAELITKVL